jgi:hypothetical protein
VNRGEHLPFGPIVAGHKVGVDKVGCLVPVDERERDPSGSIGQHIHVCTLCTHEDAISRQARAGGSGTPGLRAHERAHERAGRDMTYIGSCALFLVVGRPSEA